jgi:glycosyltransferase involved in cell wall biosynthesis
MSQDRFTVDVIIPTYNSLELLDVAIESCLAQTYPISRMIIADDGSSQESQLYLNELRKRHPNLTVLLNKHTGLPSIGRELGMKESKADWIAFLDSDDYWAPKKIEKQIEAAKEFGADLVYTNAYKVKTDNSLEIFHDSLPLTLTLSQLLKTNWIINSSVMLKRNIFDREYSYAISPRVRAVEDYATWLRLVTRYKFTGIADPLTFYRDSSSSIRSIDSDDPRIYAIADFILWSSIIESKTGRSMKSKIRNSIRVLKRQYLR